MFTHQKFMPPGLCDQKGNLSNFSTHQPMVTQDSRPIILSREEPRQRENPLKQTTSIPQSMLLVVDNTTVKGGVKEEDWWLQESNIFPNKVLMSPGLCDPKGNLYLYLTESTSTCIQMPCSSANWHGSRGWLQTTKASRTGAGGCQNTQFGTELPGHGYFQAHQRQCRKLCILILTILYRDLCMGKLLSPPIAEFVPLNFFFCRF